MRFTMNTVMRFMGALAIACVASLAFPLSARADAILSVCNNGSRVLYAAAIGVVQYATGRIEGKVDAWRKIEPGDCRAVFDSYGLSTLTANVAFLRQGDDKKFRAVKYDPKSTAGSRSRFRVEKFCIDQKGLQRTGAFDELVQLTSPPCAAGRWEVETSATAVVSGGTKIQTFILNVGAGDGAAPLPVEDGVLVESRDGRFGGSIFFRDLIHFAKSSFPTLLDAYRRSGGSLKTLSDIPGADDIYAEGNGPAPVLMCTYDSPRIRTMYFFWKKGPLQLAQPARLKALHRYHPLLMIGAPREQCPPTQSAAHALVAVNF